jgi:hypothetical protein
MRFALSILAATSLCRCGSPAVLQREALDY